MNPVDHSLWRLFKAAAQAPRRTGEALPFGFETRVLAQWRARLEEDDFAPLAGLFRRAVICAGLVMVLSIVWSNRESGGDATGVVALAGYEINTQLPP